MNLTQWIIVLTFLFLIAYDVLAGKIHQPTESMMMRDWAWRYNYFPFLFGFLIGHWFFNRQTYAISGWLLAAPMLIGLVILDLWWNDRSRPVWRYPGLWALLGIPVGMYLWGQISASSPIH